MAFADEIMAIAPGSPKLEEIRGLAVGGNPIALQRYAWWSVWKVIKEDKRFTRREAMDKFKSMMESITLKVTLDG